MNLYTSDQGWEGGVALVADSLEDAERKVREHYAGRNYYSGWVKYVVECLVEHPITSVIDFQGDS